MKLYDQYNKTSSITLRYNNLHERTKLQEKFIQKHINYV